MQRLILWRNFLLRQASEHFASPALALDENVLSYQQLLERVRHAATVLRRQGITAPRDAGAPVGEYD